MKETIYTIPVMEALENPGACLFCAMQAALEQNAINFLMGPSVAYMEDDVRMATNDTGFCGAHYQKLYETRNRLGLVLMLHTHFMEINRRLEKLYHDPPKKKNLPKYLEEVNKACYVCDMIEKSYTRYLDTFFQLFVKEETVREKLRQSRGVCLPHLSEAISYAPKKLGGANLELFCETLYTVQRAQMAKIEADLDWFVKKFDYRYHDEPWKDSKDAAERAIERLASDKPIPRPVAAKGGDGNE